MNRSALRLPTFVLLLSLSGSIATEITRAKTSKTIENYRLHMFDEPFRSLANRTIELMFDTARVDNGPDRSVLPEAKPSSTLHINSTGFSTQPRMFWGIPMRMRC